MERVRAAAAGRHAPQEHRAVAARRRRRRRHRSGTWRSTASAPGRSRSSSWSTSWSPLAEERRRSHLEREARWLEAARPRFPRSLPSWRRARSAPPPPPPLPGRRAGPRRRRCRRSPRSAPRIRRHTRTRMHMRRPAHAPRRAARRPTPHAPLGAPAIDGVGRSPGAREAAASAGSRRSAAGAVLAPRCRPAQPAEAGDPSRCWRRRRRSHT